MKSLIRTIAFIMLVLSKTTCLYAGIFDSIPVIESAHDNPYEDKDMTKAFVEENKEKLQVVIDFKIYRKPARPPVNQSYIDSSYRPNKFFSIFRTKSSSLPIECDKYITLDKTLGSYSLIFKKSDVINFGKKEMYCYANKCFDVIYQNEVADKEYEEKMKNYVEPALAEKFTK